MLPVDQRMTRHTEEESYFATKLQDEAYVGCLTSIPSQASNVLLVDMTEAVSSL